MYRKSMLAVKEIFIGIAIGAAAAAVLAKYVRNNRRALRKNTNKALHAVGSFMDNMDCMLRK